MATLTDGAGVQSASGDPGFNLTGGLGPEGGTAREENFNSSALVSTTLFRPEGQRFISVAAPGQTVELQDYDIVSDHRLCSTDFVYDPSPERGVIDVVRGFKAGGADHDVVNLVGADFHDSIADVLRNTGDVNGSAFITDPVTGDAIRLVGVSTADLKGKDFALH